MLSLLRNRHLLYILGTMLMAVGTVYLLAWRTVEDDDEVKGFNRSFVASNLEMLNVTKKNPDITGAIGSSTKYLYFKSKNPNKIFKVSEDLKQQEYIEMKFQPSKLIEYSFSPVIDSPLVYIMAGNIPGIIIADINTGSLKNSFNFPALFTKGTMISPTSFVLRMFDSKSKSLGQTFVKCNPYTGQVTHAIETFSDDEDGGMGSDGTLQYDKASNLLTYLQFYDNKLIVMDTNLNVVYSGKTIDINSKNLLKIDAVRKSNGIESISNSSPKKYLNWASCTYKGLLYNNSLVKSDSEDNEADKNNAAIDIYKITDGSYVGSLYIPNYKNEKMRQFKILNDLIVVVYVNYIVTYKLPMSFQ